MADLSSGSPIGDPKARIASVRWLSSKVFLNPCDFTHNLGLKNNCIETFLLFRDSLGGHVNRLRILIVLSALACGLTQLSYGYSWHRGAGPGERRSSTIAVSWNNICAITSTQTVKCIGPNLNGQLGNGSPVSDGVSSGTEANGSSTPVTVSGISDAVSITAGWRHFCATLADGTVKCWGLGDQGQLGNGTTGSGNYSAVPVTVTGLDKVRETRCHSRSCCAVRSDGTVKCWGNHISGNQSTPISVNFGIAIDKTDVSSAIAVDGSVYSWGVNNLGQVGDGTTTDRPTPVLISNQSSYGGAVGFYGSVVSKCFVTYDIGSASKVRCFGENNSNVLGTGLGSPVLSPATNTLLDFIPVQMALMDTNSCALRADGEVLCWGYNHLGQLGDGTNTPSTVPVSPLGVDNVVEIAVTAGLGNGGNRVCAKIADGSLKCWGKNLHSMPTGSHTFLTLGSTPVTLSGFGTLMSKASLGGGDEHSCGVRPNGEVFCWGDNAFGQVGDGTTNDRVSPTAVLGLSQVASVSAKGFHSCALLANGQIKCWGLNSSGQLGDGTTTNRTSPVSVSGITNAVMVAAGREHTCALLVDSTVKCWGRNVYGQLGDGTTSNSSSPVTVYGLNQVLQITAGNFHTCAATMNGTGSFRLRHTCWGRNNYGQLGNGTTNDSLVPYSEDFVASERLDPPRGIEAISANGDSTCKSTHSNGFVQCWGSNSSGQLGDGTTTSSSNPVSVTGSTDVCGVSLGQKHACYLTCSGSIKCWGENSSGQIGDGTTSDRLTPVSVSDAFRSRGIGLGYNHSHSYMTWTLLGTKLVESWGKNNQGQLGNGSTVNQPSPVKISFY